MAACYKYELLGQKLPKNRSKKSEYFSKKISYNTNHNLKDTGCDTIECTIRIILFFGCPRII